MYTPKKYIATIVDMPSHENYWDALRIAVKIKDLILIRFFSSHDIFYSIDNGFTGLQNSLILKMLEKRNWVPQSKSGNNFFSSKLHIPF